MKTITFIVAACLFMVACKKSDSTPENNSVSNIPVLLKVLAIDTSVAADYDTSRTTLQYDAQGRVSAVTSYDTRPTGDTFNFSILRYQYNGSDSLAFRTVKENRFRWGSVERDSDTTIYIYSNGRLVYDSVFCRNSGFAPQYNARTISYFPGYIRLHSKLWITIGNQLDDYANFYTTVSNGNIIHQLDTSEVISLGQHFWDRYDVTTNYYPNPDPLYVTVRHIPQGFIGFYYTHPFSVEHRDRQPSLLHNQNRQVNHWGYPSPSAYTYAEANTYTFRPDGYPATGERVYTRGTLHPKTLKYVYVYE